MPATRAIGRLLRAVLSGVILRFVGCSRISAVAAIRRGTAPHGLVQLFSAIRTIGTDRQAMAKRLSQ
jgi:hypothetical protein